MNDKQKKQTIERTLYGYKIANIPNPFNLTPREPQDAGDIVIEGVRAGLDGLWLSIYPAGADPETHSKRPLANVLLNRAALKVVREEIDELESVWRSQDKRADMLEMKIAELRKHRDTINKEIQQLREEGWQLRGRPRK